MTESRDYNNYLNRELSWLEFEKRVLNEAGDKDNPVLQRLKFLSITASNLDEFFMIRVATIKHLMKVDPEYRDIAGLTAAEQLEKISQKAHKFVAKQYKVYGEQKKLAKKSGIELIDDFSKLDAHERDLADTYFINNLYPILTPVAVDESRPFPKIGSLSLNILLKLQGRGPRKTQDCMGLIRVPDMSERLIRVSKKSHRYVFVEDIILNNLFLLFPDYNIESKAVFRVTRNADFELLKEAGGDILHSIAQQIELRQFSEAIRLEIGQCEDESLTGYLLRNLSLKEEDIYYIPRSLDLTFLDSIYSLPELDNLRVEKYIPKVPDKLNKNSDLYSLLDKEDLLLVHPYESYEPVIDFINKAAIDREVISIKQTLYRVSPNSQIVAALAQAAQNGKQVTVLVELKARFDESHNIEWAKMLENAGCIVLYGSADLKTHCKITLVTKRTEDGLKHYIHLGTGNYNETTARLYTDVSFFTSKEEYGKDCVQIFNMLSGYNRPQNLKLITVAPYGLKDKFIELIRREKENATKGLKGHIVSKMNSLCDPDIIDELYAASQKGVKIDLIVRGICCLKPDIPGLSENINVKSIVGNYLEHSRIFKFENGGKPEFYCASADWMPRNFERRVETMFPVLDEIEKEKLNLVLTTLLSDNCKAYKLSFDGKYLKEDNLDKILVNSQETLKYI